jgi:MYXO-CTERM domain-containing protein
MTGVATPAATCDGNGGCPPAQSIQCGRFACQGSACGSAPCDSNDDCARNYRCETSTRDCVPIGDAVCDPDGRTLRKPDGTTQDCAPYACEAGACRTSCTSHSECASGNTCQGSGICASGSNGSWPNIAFSDEKGCACSVPAPGASHGAWSALLGLLLFRRRRRTRRAA